MTTENAGDAYDNPISSRVACESFRLDRITISSHATDLLDDGTLIVDFQRLLELTLMDT